MEHWFPESFLANTYDNEEGFNAFFADKPFDATQSEAWQQGWKEAWERRFGVGYDANVASYHADYALGSSAYCTGERFDPKWSEAKMEGWIDTSYEQAMQEDCMNIK